MLERRENRIYEHLARIGKALASPPRLAILDLLCQGERTVEVLAGEAGLSVANTSRHLQILRGARLVEARRERSHVSYRLADPEVSRFCLALRDLGRHRLTEVEQLARDALAAHPNVSSITLGDLRRRLGRGDVVLLDVRPTEEFRAGHIPGAVSIPLKELARQLSGLPRSREIVAYCRGPYCLMAVQAVELLEHHDFHARRLEEGIADWRANGLRVAVGDEPNRPKQRSVSVRMSK